MLAEFQKERYIPIAGEMFVSRDKYAMLFVHEKSTQGLYDPNKKSRRVYEKIRGVHVESQQSPLNASNIIISCEEDGKLNECMSPLHDPWEMYGNVDMFSGGWSTLDLFNLDTSPRIVKKVCAGPAFITKGPLIKPNETNCLFSLDSIMAKHKLQVMNLMQCKTTLFLEDPTSVLKYVRGVKIWDKVFQQVVNVQEVENEKWLNAPFDPGGTGPKSSEMTREVELFGRVVIITNRNRVDVPFDPGGFGLKTKLEDEFFSKTGSMMQEHPAQYLDPDSNPWATREWRLLWKESKLISFICIFMFLFSCLFCGDLKFLIYLYFVYYKFGVRVYCLVSFGLNFIKRTLFLEPLVRFISL
ncbi:hypothetical protein HanRHA438_Chr09g0396891 [Helianthus annuus]|nr:hypothetical protein HanRHA438_Chr09g0396891 [Helianthus annuus]